jgi:hypothetical protein
MYVAAKLAFLDRFGCFYKLSFPLLLLAGLLFCVQEFKIHFVNENWWLHCVYFRLHLSGFNKLQHCLAFRPGSFFYCHRLAHMTNF